MTLWEALQKLQDYDDADEIDLLAHLEAVEATKDKVDAYKTVIDQLGLQADFWREKSNEALKAARRAEATVERIKARMISTLQSFETPELVGNQYRVKLSFAPKVEIKREPQPSDLLNHDELLRTKLEWNKTKILEAAKADSSTVEDFASLVSSPSLRFSYARTPKSARSSSKELQDHH